MTVRTGGLYPQRPGALSRGAYSFRNGGWADLATALGMGILSADGENVSLPQGIALGLQNFQRMASDRKQEARQDWQDQMTQQQFDLTKSEAEARVAERTEEKARRERMRALLMGGGPAMPIGEGGPAGGQFTAPQGPGLAPELGLPEVIAKALAEEGDPTVFATLFGQKATRDAQTKRDADSMAWDREKFAKQYDLDVKQLGLSAANAAASRRIQEAELELKKQELTGGGPFKGTSMEAQDTNILLRGDPASPEYKASYDRQAQEKLIEGPNGKYWVKPNMSAYRVPTFTGSTADNLAPSGLTGANSGNVYGSGSQVSEIPGMRGTPSENANLRAAVAEARTIAEALNDYADEFAKASPGDLAKANVGWKTPVGAAFTNAILLAKSEALYNLGVLQKIDMDVIEKALADPGSISGALGGADVASMQVNKVLDLMETRINSKLDALGQSPVKLPRPADTRSGNNNDRTKPPFDQAIKEAKDAIARGADRDAVITRIINMGYDPTGL